MCYTAEYTSPLGKILLSSDGASLTGLWFEGAKYYAAGITKPVIKNDLLIFKETERWLDIYFSGQKPDFTPPLKPTCSAFSRKVLDILLQIPYGKVVTYKDIAKEISDRMSSQAVGGAVGHNPISIIIPCHRVIGSDGSLTGYAGGIERKRALLKLEGING